MVIFRNNLIIIVPLRDISMIGSQEGYYENRRRIMDSFGYIYPSQSWIMMRGLGI